MHHESQIIHLPAGASATGAALVVGGVEVEGAEGQQRGPEIIGQVSTIVRT